MLACWQEDALSRPSFIQLRADFDSMLAKQKNANELYIELQTVTELQPCHELEVTKVIDNSKSEESTYAQRSCQSFYSKDDSEDDSSRYVDNPKRDVDSVKQSLQLNLDEPSLLDIQFLSSPAQVAHTLENALPLLPDLFSLPSVLKPEEITDEFPTFEIN